MTALSIAGPSYRESTSSNMSSAPADLENANAPCARIGTVGLDASAGAMGFAVPPGFVASLQTRPRQLMSTQLGWITVADRLSLRGPLGSFGQLLQGDLRRSSGRGSHRPPIAQRWALRLLGPFTASQPE